jgi:hypothetical protein
MSSNPYSPPKAAVRDRPAVPVLLERPKHITVAIWLLWTSLAFGIPLGYFDYLRVEDEEYSALSLVMGGVFLVIGILLNIFITRRHNWARVVYVALVAISLAFVPFLVTEWVDHPFYEVALTVATIVLDVIVVYLLFTKPGSLWFRFHPQG